IQHNNPNRLEVVENIDKKLKAESQNLPASTCVDRQAGQNGEIKFIHSDRVENEADEVAKEITKLLDSSHESLDNKNSTRDQRPLTIDYKDIAILVRANNHAEPFIRAFQRHGIPHQFLGPGKLFKQTEIVDLISYLKVLFDFDDSVAFLNVLSIEHFDISAKDLVKIGSYGRRFNLSLFEACEKIDEVSVSDDTKKRIQKLLELIDKHLKLVSKETAGQILYDFLQDTGLIQKLINPDSPQAEEKVKNISKFFDKLKTYEANHEDAGVSAICNWLELLSELGESPLAADTDWTEVNAVNILTIHSSKGLEFPVVFLVNLVSQRFPTMNRREQIPIPDELVKEILPEGDFHIQEERRLFYVGMTRAMNKLYFTAANFYGEGKRQKKLSPFIFEALGDEAASAEPSAKGEQLSFLDYQSPKTPHLPPPTSHLPLHIDYLSYSQIQTFQICPLHYKLKYILKVPTAPTAPLSFGISIHEALNDFYLAVKNGKRANKKLMTHVLKNNWKELGYRNKTHEKKMYEKGEVYLSEFLKVGFDPKVETVGLEQSFVVPLAPPKHSVKLDRQLKIGGKIDRVDVLSGKNIEIIDYKTGANIPTQKQIDKDFQLPFYALAAAKIIDPPFNKKPSEIALSLYYLEEQKKLTTTRTQAQLDKAEIEIFKWREKIEKSDFKCSGHMFCKSCEFALMCQVQNNGLME
ncbi:ATP-dependent helicase, partial [Patescibacteria group bacterium]|nr:ATP-dependent helicase [Patescibacteria group bacterium]